MSTKTRIYGVGGNGHVVVVVLLFFSLLCTSCFNDHLQPVAPTWDVDLTLPLANRLYTLADVIHKDPGVLRVGTDNQLIYSATVQTNPTYVGDIITLEPAPTTQSVNLGLFTVAPPPVVLPLQIPWLPGGTSMTIPDTTVAVSSLSGSMSSFASVTIESGTLTLTLQNNLPVPVVVINPITLSDGSGTVASFVFAGADSILSASGGTSTSLSNLAGKTVGNSFQLAGIGLHVYGSSGPVSIPAGALIQATLAGQNLKVRRATLAQIPAQQIADNQTASLALNDSTIVKEVFLRSGILDISFSNHIPLALTVKFRVSELQRQVGGAYVPYDDSLFLPVLGTASMQVDIRGDKIQSPTGNLVRSLELISSMFLAGSTSPVTVNDTDKVTITISPGSKIVADSAVAVLKPTMVNLNSTFHFTVGELPSKYSGQLNIPVASMGLNALSSIGFPMDLNVQLSAMNPIDGQWVYLDIPASQRRIQPGTSFVQFDSTQVGAFLSKFSGKFPDSLHLSGNVLVNPPDAYAAGTPGTIGRNCSMGGTVQLDVPMNLGISGGLYTDTLSLGDTSGSGYTNHTVDKSRIKDMNSGSLCIEVENGLPVQVGVTARLLDIGKQNLLVVPQAGATPVVVGAAQVDANGRVTAPVRSSFVIPLSEQDIRQFNPAEYFAQAISLMSSSGSPSVRFRTTDYIRIKIWSRLSFRVNK